MKLSNISSIAIAAVVIVACGPSKKSTGSAASTAPATATAPAVSAKPSTGIFAPGNEELIAIQARYKDVTMQTLNDGHALYIGKCTGCHAAQSIYSRPEEKWPSIITEMAQKTKLTEAEKDAVFKYVLAIKATQGK